HNLQEVAALDPSAQPLAERATELLVLAEDLARDARDYAEGIEGDPERLAMVDDRLNSLQILKRKYGTTLEEVIAYREQIELELQELSADKYDPSVLNQRLEEAEAKARSLAEQLTA